MVRPVFKTATSRLRGMEGSTPSLLRHCEKGAVPLFRQTGVRAAAIAAVLAVLCATSAAAASPTPRSAARESFTGRVVSVRDGDTLDVMRGGRTERVRLVGIDCPEWGQPFGRRAKREASTLAGGAEVRVDGRGRDRLGRLLAEVILPDGRSLNREMVRAGLAWWYRRYSKDGELQALEAEARRNRRGLWAGAAAVPPWEYRQRQRRRRGT